MTKKVAKAVTLTPESKAALRGLKVVRRRLEKGWCQGYFAIGKSGVSVNWDSSAAIAYCVLGACSGQYPARKAIALAIKPKSEFTVWLGQWNDTRGRTQQQVLAKVDEAIAKVSDGRISL